MLAMHETFNSDHFEYEVYDDFATNSWRNVGKTTDLFIPWNQRCGVYFKGSTYWFALNVNRPYDCFLLSFDFSTETFQRQSTPLSDLLKCVAALSVVREEQLCLLATHPHMKTFDVWMGTKSESTGVMLWCKFLTANPTYEFSRGMSFLADEQNKVVLCYDYNMFPNNILHIVGEDIDRHIQVGCHGAESSYSRLHSYVPTLVQIPQVI